MFTGLIREFAEVESYANNILTLRATYKPNIGDSIAINGACLTVIALSKSGFSVELSLESRSLLAVENLKGKVHMEPALALGDRLDGHMVQGHVDCTATVTNIIQLSASWEYHIQFPSQYAALIVHTGSICINGISLTVADCGFNTLKVAIIPHTYTHTTIADLAIGDMVNLEFDIFGKYIERLLYVKQYSNEQ